MYFMMKPIHVGKFLDKSYENMNVRYTFAPKLKHTHHEKSA